MKIFLLFAAISLAANAIVQTITQENKPQRILEKHTFLVIAYHDADTAKNAAKLLIDAEQLYEKQSHEFSPKLAFALCDYEKYPGLVHGGGSEAKRPKVILLSNALKQRELKIDMKLTPELEETSQFLADTLNKFTGNQFRNIASCAEIDALGSQVSFIYLGERRDIEGGSLTHLHTLAALDGFNHPFEQVNYYYNEDKQCRDDLDLPKNKRAIALNLHKNYPPIILDESETDINSVKELQEWISIQVSFLHLQWGERTLNLLKAHEFNVIVLMLPKFELDSHETPLVQQFHTLTRYCQEHLYGILPIVQDFEPELTTQKSQTLPQLQKMLNVQAVEDLPALFIMHGREGINRKYPFSMDLQQQGDKVHLSAEMMIMWARAEILGIELPILDDYISDHWDDEDFDQSLYEMQEEGQSEFESAKKQFAELRITGDYIKDDEASFKNEDL